MTSWVLRGTCCAPAAVSPSTTAAATRTIFMTPLTPGASAGLVIVTGGYDICPPFGQPAGAGAPAYVRDARGERSETRFPRYHASEASVAPTGASKASRGLYCAQRSERAAS